MTDHIQFEAKKDGLRQMQDGVIKLTLSVHPQDTDINRLFAAPMGKIYQVVLVDSEAIQEPDKKDTLTQQAAIMSQEAAFIKFAESQLITPFANGPEAMRHLCNVSSRSEIKEGTDAGKRFKQLKAEYDYWLTHA